MTKGEGVTIVNAVNAEEDGKVIGYMCLIDFEWEIGAASGGSKVYPSVEDLKADHTCWAGCGIVEVRVAFHSVIVPEPSR